MENKKQRFYREPIFLFFLLGVVLFALYSLLAARFDQKSREIAVSPAEVDFITETFKKTWSQDPSDKELEAQVQNYIKEEVLFREAVAMGLDRADPAIKRRLRQLMELMMDDAATVYPSEDQLRMYLREHPEKFQEDPIITFEHLYFASESKNDADAQLQKLTNDLPIDRDKISFLSLVPSTFENESKFAIGRTLGTSFADAVFELDTGRWEGPVRSAYGWHLVFIKNIQPGKVPALAEIWNEVAREWTVEQKNIKKEQQYHQMKSNYTIVFSDDK